MIKTINSSNNKAFKQELIKKNMKTLEERTEKFITKSCGGGINIDWQNLADLKKTSISSHDIGNFERIKEELFEYLLDQNIMTVEETPGTYIVMQSNFPANPRSSSGMRYNFTREKDAKEYAKYFFSEDAKVDVVQFS